RAILADESVPLANRGTFSFDRDPSNPLDANYAYANALLGVYQSYTEPAAIPRGEFRFLNAEFFAQDTWRARRILASTMDSVCSTIRPNTIAGIGSRLLCRFFIIRAQRRSCSVRRSMPRAIEQPL